MPVASRLSLVTGFAGFTLFEIILVASTLVLLMVLSVPRFQRGAQRLGVEQAAFQYTQLLRYARQRAVSQGDAIVWVWNPAERRVQLFKLSRLGDEAAERLEGRAVRSPTLEDAAVLSISYEVGGLPCPAGIAADAQCVRFLPDGTSEDATISIAYHGGTYKVSVDAASGQAILSSGFLDR